MNIDIDITWKKNPVRLEVEISYGSLMGPMRADALTIGTPRDEEDMLDWIRRHAWMSWADDRERAGAGKGRF
jgi:hypothetical protein